MSLYTYIYHIIIDVILVLVGYLWGKVDGLIVGDSRPVETADDYSMHVPCPCHGSQEFA